MTLPHPWKYLQNKHKNNTWSWSSSVRASNLHCKFTVSFRLEMDSCTVCRYGNSQYSDTLLAFGFSGPSVLAKIARMVHSWPFYGQQWAEQEAVQNTVKVIETEQPTFNGCIKHKPVQLNLSCSFIPFPSWHAPSDWLQWPSHTAVIGLAPALSLAVPGLSRNLVLLGGLLHYACAKWMQHQAPLAQWWLPRPLHLRPRRTSGNVHIAVRGWSSRDHIGCTLELCSQLHSQQQWDPDAFPNAPTLNITSHIQVPFNII